MKRALLLALFLLFAGARAQWTVQTVALQDYGEALSVGAQLQALDYDAYVDFGLFEGQQYVRVRVGCFADQDSAAFFANSLAGRVTAEAVAVPLEAQPGGPFCVQRVVGFEPPASWDVLATRAPGISFWVEVLGQRRFIVFTGTAWRVAQTEQDLADLADLAPPLASATVFEQDEARVLCSFGGTRVNVATGRLLWQGGAWAVVLEDGAVTAYHVKGVD